MKTPPAIEIKTNIIIECYRRIQYLQQMNSAEVIYNKAIFT